MAARRVYLCDTLWFCWGYIDLISHTWDLALLEKHGQMIEKVLGRGVSDADPTARQHAQRYTDHAHICCYDNH